MRHKICRTTAQKVVGCKIPENIMLDEEGVVARLENKVLHEGLRNVLVRLINKGVHEW